MSCPHSQAKRVLNLKIILTGPLNYRHLKWRSQIIMILKKTKSTTKSSCLCRFLTTIILSPLNQNIHRISWVSPVILRGNLLMLNQWTGPSVKSTMSQYLRLQFLLVLLQYIVQNLSQLIVLAYPFQHINEPALSEVNSVSDPPLPQNKPAIFKSSREDTVQSTFYP